MMDADIVAASPSLVYRVPSQAGALRCWEAKPSKKGKGFVPRSGWLTDRRSQPMRIGTLNLYRRVLLAPAIICAVCLMAPAAPSTITKSASR